VFVSFGFWPIDSDPIHSDKFHKVTINPELNFNHVFHVTITANLIRHIEASALEIDVLGSGVSNGGSNSNETKENHSESTTNQGQSNENEHHHTVVANKRIRELEEELEKYKKRENMWNSMIDNNPNVQIEASNFFQKAGVDQSSVCTVC
jgi:hypothetical protein